MNGFSLLLETFRQEAAELLDELAGILEAQRRGGSDPGNMIAARRVVHNLKGAALTVGAARVAEPCHALEDEFEGAARSGAAVPEAMLQGWLSTVTELQGLVDNPDLVAVPEATDAAPDPAPTQTRIRVETRRLDDVVEQVREVAQTQARLASQCHELQRLHEDLSRSAIKGEPLGELLSAITVLMQEQRQEMQDFGYLVDALGASVAQVRMTPLADMVPLWQRTVRETARDLGRGVELEVDVGEVEVDLHLYELVKAPLLHVLRNAVAHGVESGEERARAGKPASGRIRVAARADGAYVTLRVSDDGRGIDPERVSSKALDSGFISREALAGLGDAERRALVFLPGFSTAEVVNQVAGRGMGLNSVQRNIEELGGVVAISDAPELGGTTFELQIPATVLSVQGLLVSSGAVTYALPLQDVVEVAAAAASALERSQGSLVFRDSRGRPVRVRELTELIGSPPGPARRELKLVVLRRGTQELALALDAVLGRREFVTRPLPWNLAETPGVNGALILPDGSLALCLDSAHLLAAAQHTRAAPPEPVRARAHRILVVDDSSSVRTLESRTLNGAGYEVACYADGAQAWEALQREPFDLVVSDVQMPHMDGLELTARIRGSVKLRQLPIVLITGLGAPDDVERGAEAGADAYVVKGALDQQKLLEAVRRLLR